MTIKDLRHASGMTQQAFADYFGIPQRTIENWEATATAGGRRSCPGYLLDLIHYKLQKDGMLKI